MKSKAIAAERFQPIAPDTLPVGEYTGAWFGYAVTVEIAGQWYRLVTILGARGPVPCTVSVSEDGVEVWT